MSTFEESQYLTSKNLEKDILTLISTDLRPISSRWESSFNILGQFISEGGRGAYHRDSVRASHSAAKGSNLSLDFFFSILVSSRMLFKDLVLI